jgi:(S)-ureidoglycine aminohydrolase
MKERCMTPLYGHTRSVVRPHYALFTPDGMVRAPLPGWPGAECIVAIGPALGARFAQLLITLPPGAMGVAKHPEEECFFFVRSGAVEMQVAAQTVRLTTGGYAYLPPHTPYQVRSDGVPAAELIVFQRRYVPLDGVEPPEPVIGHEDAVTGAPFLGDDAALLKTLLPDVTAFDMAVNIFTFQPGATLPFVETHVMEHGMQMILGQGIYRLGDDWHPVQDGDVIWMAPWCPQWFVATGKSPARYIYYKDVNRSPWN